MGAEDKARTSYHDRRLARRLKEDPVFRAEYVRRRKELDRAALRDIPSAPVDGEAMLADLERAEAPVDDPPRG